MDQLDEPADWDRYDRKAARERGEGRGFRAPPVIEHPDAYANAVTQRVRANATQTRRSNWLAADPTRAELETWLHTGAHSGFLQKMADNLAEWGHLTPGQEAAVRKARDERIAKQAEWAEQAARSEHIGTVGKREVFHRLELVSVYEDEGPYGLTFAHKFKDANGNILHWKTQRAVAERGAIVSLKATVKSHHVNKDGVKSTILTRATVEN